MQQHYNIITGRNLGNLGEIFHLVATLNATLIEFPDVDLLLSLLDAQTLIVVHITKVAVAESIALSRGEIKVHLHYVI